jgi:DNA-binding transcriptional LysR family regulator
MSEPVPSPPPYASGRVPNINFKYLLLFTRVAALGSIAAAARELGIDASVAARQLAALETALSIRLFQRTTRSIKLTEAGGIALEWAEGLLQGYAFTADRLSRARSETSGVVRIAATHHTSVNLIPEFLSGFSARYPGVSYSITTTDDLVNLVERGFDIAIHAGRVPDSSVICRRLVQYERVLCATPAYLARRGVPQSIEELGRHDCLVHGPTERGNWWFRHDEQLSSVAIRPLAEADNHVMLMALTLQDLGILRISSDIVHDDIAAGRLVRLLPDYVCVYSNGEGPALWLIYPHRQVLGRVRIFIDALTKFISAR